MGRKSSRAAGLEHSVCNLHCPVVGFRRNGRSSPPSVKENVPLQIEGLKPCEPRAARAGNSACKLFRESRVTSVETVHSGTEALQSFFSAPAGIA